jgi:hypothetical protein
MRYEDSDGSLQTQTLTVADASYDSTDHTTNQELNFDKFGITLNLSNVVSTESTTIYGATIASVFDGQSIVFGGESSKITGINLDSTESTAYTFTDNTTYETWTATVTDLVADDVDSDTTDTLVMNGLTLTFNATANSSGVVADDIVSIFSNSTAGRKAGDVVDVTVAGVGTLTGTVGAYEITGSAGVLTFTAKGTFADADNITATNNITLTSLSNLNTVGTITTGVWNGTVIDIAHGGTGLSKAGRTGQVLTTATDGSLTWTSLTTQTATHSIGESFGGGIIFYVWDNGRHGLIAATSNLSFGGTTGFTWGPTANYVMAIRNGINAGMSNTERIIMKQGAGIGNYAAMVAAHYQFNGNGWGDYGDWYLPSLYELQLLFKQKNDKRLNFTNTTYVWSSTEADDKTAYTLNFFSTGGTVQAEPKNLNPRSVRAIRAF